MPLLGPGCAQEMWSGGVGEAPRDVNAAVGLLDAKGYPSNPQDRASRNGEALGLTLLVLAWWHQFGQSLEVGWTSSGPPS
jgi:hypothetical protein